MGTLNYTTTIAAAKTVSEMQALLGKHGADAVQIRYTDRRPAALAFILDTPHGPRHFTLPVDVDAVHALLKKQWVKGQIRRAYNNREQAERTAWRVLKVWLEAQLAIVETQMVSLDQVMLPYLQINAETTLYDAYRERENTLQLTTGDT